VADSPQLTTGEQPLFADTWYSTPSVQQLRQEIQNLYEIIRGLEERIETLETP